VLFRLRSVDRAKGVENAIDVGLNQFWAHVGLRSNQKFNLLILRVECLNRYCVVVERIALLETAKRVGLEGIHATFASGVLAFTRAITANAPGAVAGASAAAAFAGQILDADTLFRNDGQVTFVTPGALAELQGADAYDLESLLTHELGHWVGLDHSAVIRAMMFPFAPPPGQFLGERPDGSVPDGPLADDDRTGFRAQYPDRTIRGMWARFVAGSFRRIRLRWRLLQRFARRADWRDNGRTRSRRGLGNRLGDCGDAGRLELRCGKPANPV
jgi:Matrixin